MKLPKTETFDINLFFKICSVVTCLYIYDDRSSTMKDYNMTFMKHYINTCITHYMFHQRIRASFLLRITLLNIIWRKGYRWCWNVINTMYWLWRPYFGLGCLLSYYIDILNLYMNYITLLMAYMNFVKIRKSNCLGCVLIGKS